MFGRSAARKGGHSGHPFTQTTVLPSRIHSYVMNTRTLTLCALFLAKAIPISAGNKTDLVVLKNGDRLTCEIKSLNSGILYLSLGYARGTISVNWTEVAELKSGQMFIVKTEDGFFYRGTLSTTVQWCERSMNIEVVEGTNQKVSLEQSRVVGIYRTY